MRLAHGEAHRHPHPVGITSPRAALFNYDWITLLVVVIIVVLGALYNVFAHPGRRIQESSRRGSGR